MIDFNTLQGLIEKVQDEARAGIGKPLAHDSRNAEIALREYIADIARQSTSDLRNHPDFLKLVEHTGALERSAVFLSNWNDILEEKLEISSREIALFREKLQSKSR